MSEQNKIIGMRIKERRRALKISQKELGERIGCAEITIRQYESGRYSPKIDTRIALANALGVSYADLFIPDQTSISPNTAETTINIDALKRGDVEGAIKEPADIIMTVKDENGNPINYSDHYEPQTIDEERDQFIDLLLKTNLSAEKRAELLNYFDFIKYKEQRRTKD